MLMGELATAVKYKLPIKIVVVKNNTLGQIRWEQMAFLGNPEYGCDLAPIDFAEVARACGATGFSLKVPGLARTAGRLSRRTGLVVNLTLVNANEPRVKPRFSSRQAISFAEALAKGTRMKPKLSKAIRWCVVVWQVMNMHKSDPARNITTRVLEESRWPSAGIGGKTVVIGETSARSTPPVLLASYRF